MDNKQNTIRAGRNSFSHDNYFSSLKLDTKNISCYDDLRSYLSHDQQRKVDKLEKDDCII